MKELEQDFNDYISEYRLFGSCDRLLVGVSGGIDSVVLCQLLKSGGYDFEMAHVNYQLRGEESFRDEAFCRELANNLGVSFHRVRYDTRDYARQLQINIQVAARELRYSWFNSLLEASLQSANPLKYLLTAHHAGDNAETVLMNLCRGAGLSGLTGIDPKMGQICRPLLFAHRSQIRNYAESYGIKWVEDSSNAEEKYSRNFFRHQVLPLIQERFPSVINNINATALHLKQADQFFKASMEHTLAQLVEKKGEEQFLPIRKWQQLAGKEAILFEWLYPFGFSSGQMKDLVRLAVSQTGHYINSNTHRVIRNRNWLLLTPVSTLNSEMLIIEDKKGRLLFREGQISWEQVDYKGQSFPEDSCEAWLDASGVTFPLVLRPWKAGDYFYPLGMRKKKKLSRFFIDIKLSRVEKEKIWVLESEGRILWVLGKRIDDRFRITTATQKVLQVKFSSAI